MKHESNIFGEGTLFQEDDLKTPIYFYCTACTSILAETLSWANAHEFAVTTDPHKAKSIVVLGCQVTDIAVLNDLHAIDDFSTRFPNTHVYLGGCLARRFDIPLGPRCRRLDNVRHDYQPIIDRSLVTWAVPFWTKNWQEGAPERTEGHLFRNSYPLRIGAGCKNKCSYCTIRVTRGEGYELDPNCCRDEFCRFGDVVLIADSPSLKLLTKWIGMALLYDKMISLRNVEPDVAVGMADLLIALAERKLLRVFHCPVQALNWDAVRDMLRSPQAVQDTVELSHELRKRSVVTATNVILDYKEFKNTYAEAQAAFSCVAWNPYWDGQWDREIAEQRWQKYLGAD